MNQRFHRLMIIHSITAPIPKGQITSFLKPPGSGTVRVEYLHFILVSYFHDSKIRKIHYLKYRARNELITAHGVVFQANEMSKKTIAFF